MEAEVLGAFSTLMTQVGSRHLAINFTNAQKKLMAHPISQALILLGMFYMTTRRILVALLLLIVYYITVLVLINENHPWNVMSRPWLVSQGYKHQDKSSQELYYENVNKLP